MALSLTVVNLASATFECIFGRGCEGICCKNGRPSVGKKEQARIKSVLKRALPLMRPDARELVDEEGYLSKRTKDGKPMVRVVDSWCVFFNEGCVLHKLGAEDGNSYQYKPVQCALFPLEKDDGDWHVRQWDHNGEAWDLFCLNPKQSKQPAITALAAEIEMAKKMEAAGEC
jgi:Fe-S-cluster containining protein